MARGAPRLWGLALGSPTVAGGAFALSSGGPGSPPAEIGYPFVALGTLAIALGFYVNRMSPEAPDVEPIEVFKPSQLSAYLLGAVSLPCLAVTLYLLFETRVPYVWPTLTFVAFVFLFVKALVRYWQNSLTTYYVTHDRVVSEYRFLSLNRVGTNVDAIENVVRRQSAVETLTGLGSVTVRSPSGNVSLRDLSRPAEAERLLNSLSRR